ncbi:MAG: chromosome segregation protein SMC [Clostridiales bacterium]|nr:chromosome segregation protein SMC [Clostridiales bacterium]
MYLKALEIQGFKSFPDKTVLNFGEDITAIVGPNGSGKSNISDAIRWVMGEQNSRQLRGTKMEDVIFGGTEKRRAMGFAQVTLVIDNTEHIFNRDEAEVAVTRRYYRSGESEYYINRQSVRLKDVNELFMDTGMGREGYSIIGQGKIDEILSVRSDDRREVFEEAAGISKYRHRKEESERKLQRTEENLVRINDKITELELQVEPLRKQAETAKKYLVLRDELRTLEISVWLENLQKLKADRLKLQADFETAQADQKKAQDELDRVYAQAEECSRLLHENDCAAEEKRGRISALESAIGEHESAAAVARTTAQHHAETIERMDREMSESRSRTESLHEQMQVMARRMEEIDASARTLENEIAALCEEMRGSSDAAAAAAAQLEQLRRWEAQEVAGAAQAQAELSAITAGSDEIAQRTAELTEELTQSEEKLTQTRREAAQNEKELLSAREEEQAAANIIGGHSLKMEGRQRRAKESIEQKNQLSLQEKTISDRIRLLSEMEKEYEGFSKAVKIVMRAAEARTLSGIHGPVGNLIHTDKDCSVAIEIALGGALQHIVVDTKNDGKNAIGLLKQRDGGRATFLPLDTIRGRSLRENGLENEYGFVGIASELVRCDGRYGSVIENLLGATVVVEDLDCGIQMAKRHDNRFRIVTLDGQVINAGGSMTGGSVSRNAGILSRSGELEQLHKKLKKIQSQLQDATLLAESANRELQKAQYELEVARDQQRQANDRVLTLEGRKNHYDMLIESLEQQHESLRIQKENLQKRSTDDAGRMDTIRRTIADFTARAEETREEIEMLQRRQETARQGLGEMTDRLTEKKAQQAALSAEGESARRSMEDLSRLRESLEGEHTDRESLRAQMEQAMAQARAEEERQQQEARELRGGIEEHRQALQKLSEEKMALETRRSQTDRLSRTCNDTLLNCEREVTRLEGKLNGSALEEKQILDKLWERYELSHSDAQALRVELESMPKATRRIGELNREIKGLGAINIGAIEEFDRVNTRYTYLSDQRNDVEKAEEELLGIIEEITKQMTEIFAAQFEILKQSFQETFLELFGGGRATLELEDENDILRCGIEIKAQPPGKQLKTLSLLSGGEKAFVAIALYFAILKVHPTPFCVMDEIEAALDESNVVRYARYMRRIAGKTQFIVITHRRGTMEEADVLYGITMQERGVSTVLTANLNELSKEMKIK